MTQTSRKIKGRRECGKLDKTGSTDGTLANTRDTEVVISLKKAINQWLRKFCQSL